MKQIFASLMGMIFKQKAIWSVEDLEGWCVVGHLNRMNGPAVERDNGTVWYEN